MSESFKRPDFDDTVIIPRRIQYNGRHSPDHPLFVYWSHARLQTITWSQVARAIENAARIVYAHLKFCRGTSGLGTQPPVVGILANIDTITYHTLVWGIVRAGGTAFLISPRNSRAAIAHLLKETRTQLLLLGADERVLSLATFTPADAENHAVSMKNVPVFNDLYSGKSERDYTYPMPDCAEDSIDQPAIILHSSGTTSFPKAVPLSHRHLIQWIRIASLTAENMTNRRMAIHGLSAFHGMGYLCPPWAASTGMSLSVFPPQNPPIVPSSQNVLEGAVACTSNILLSIPFFVELWSQNAESVEQLKQFDAVMYGGGHLNKKVGDELEQVGVSLIGLYGTTEVGPVSQLFFGRGNDEWDWLNMSPACDPRYLPQDDPEVLELVYLECCTHSPAVYNCELEGKRAFATNDLVIRHTKNPLKFKFFGRKDDQIILSTGEKTNPGPIELILCKNPLINFAVLFGQGRNQNGVLLQPSKEHEIDPNDQAALCRYRDEVWLSVEESNVSAPTHSRLFKEMILVTHPSKPMELTSKLTPRRKAVLEVYKEEIDATYAAVEASVRISAPPPSAWTPGQVLEFVRTTVHGAMRKEQPVGDDDDIFDQGGDSLQATHIRNSILRISRKENKASTDWISQNFVYANPSISQLTRQLLAIIHSSSRSLADEADSKASRLTEIISQYSVFPKYQPSTLQKLSLGEVVLLTGTTGGLGSQMLAHLASLPDLLHVYALNRPSDNGHLSLRERQEEALTRRGLSSGILNQPNVTLVEGNTAAENLGLDPMLYSELRDNVTLIIHNAWRVNFVLALESFKPMIRGVKNLIDLALSSPNAPLPRIIFMGSMGVYRHSLLRPLEGPIEDPSLVLGNGYSESKWVGERILEEAAKHTPLRPVIVRIGQITSNASGAWNSRDWLPAIVRSGQVLGALPSRNQRISWISADTAARAIFEFRMSRSQYLHLAHPNPVPWDTVFTVFSTTLNVPLVPWADWLAKLEKDHNGPEINPAVQLLDFFRNTPSTYGEHKEAIDVPLLSLTEALNVSPSLADPDLPRISGASAKAWVNYWKTIGFLDKYLGT